MSVLKYGSKGSEVRDLQTQLNKLGAGLTIDGSFGPATSRAVSDFQSEHGLDVDGVAGPKTMEKLTQAINECIGSAVRECVAAVSNLPEFDALTKLL